jgi:hypothetical protein
MLRQLRELTIGKTIKYKLCALSTPMFKALKVSDRLFLVCLLRLEKTEELGSSARCILLERLGRKLEKVFPQKELGKLQDQLFVLGGASSALLVSSESLDNTAEIKETINETLNSLSEAARKLNSACMQVPQKHSSLLDFVS